MSDLYLKPMRAEQNGDAGLLWAIFEDGQLKHPLVVLRDFEMKDFIKISEKTAPFMAGMNPQPLCKCFQICASTCVTMQASRNAATNSIPALTKPDTIATWQTWLNR